VIQNGTIRKLGCGFLFAFHSNYGSILHYLRDIGRKSRVFIAPLHSTPPLGNLPSRLVRKTRMMGLPDGDKNFEDIYNRLDRIPACDRRPANGQTDRHLATA